MTLKADFWRVHILTRSFVPNTLRESRTVLEILNDAVAAPSVMASIGRRHRDHRCSARFRLPPLKKGGWGGFSADAGAAATTGGRSSLPFLRARFCHYTSRLMPLHCKKEHKGRSRDLRNNMTEAERTLWSRIRRKQVLGLQFYRQKPIHQYIVDFYCSKAGLVIEIDGGQHWRRDHAEQDRERDAVLQQLGLKVLRFSNIEVLSQLDGVLATLHEVSRKQLAERSEASAE